MLTSHFRNTVHIIAQKIHNHHIFRPIFRVLFQPTGLLQVFFVSHATLSRSLHRSRCQLATILLKKELWTHGYHCHLVMFNIGIVARLLLYHHTIVDGKRIGRQLLLELDGVVDLIGVSLPQMMVNLSNRLFIVCCRRYFLPV